MLPGSRTKYGHFHGSYKARGGRMRNEGHVTHAHLHLEYVLVPGM